MLTSKQYLHAVDRAASLWGITPDFWDIFGKPHVTPAETKVAILRSLGMDVSSAESVEQAIERRLLSDWERMLPACLVISEVAPHEIPLSVPRYAASVRIDLTREDGVTASVEEPLKNLPESGASMVGGEPYVLRRVKLTIPVPVGYHVLTATVNHVSAQMQLIVTPDRAWPPERRSAGIAVALYGLRSARNWGCGDFRDLRDFCAWAAADLRVSFVALNPLHAIHNRRPYNTSPYLPNSTFFRNFIYLDVEAVPEFHTASHARRLWNDPAVQRQLAQLRATEFVEYEPVAALKLRFLRAMFIAFLHSADAERRRAFDQFAAAEGELLDRFATYCALDESIHRAHPEVWVWQEWPEPFRDPRSPAVRRFAERHWRSVLFHKWLQWLLDGQLAEAQAHARQSGLPVGLYHDLALATDRFGSDLWAHREFFVTGCRVGSPPDGFSPSGQDWAFPPPNSEQHRATGYALFRAAIANNLRHGGALRLDHVMRFFRLYWIPENNDALHGSYVRDRYEDLIRILVLESVRHNAVIVGEDLGTVEPYVREVLAKFGILSYRLLYFERESGGDFKTYQDYPEQALVSATTHDLPTIAGFWIGIDIETRFAAGLIDDATRAAQHAARAGDKQKLLDALFAAGLMPDWASRNAAEYHELTGELHNAVIGFLALSPARWMAINQEELTKELHQQNLPGATSQYPNWARKMQLGIDELSAAGGYSAMLRDWLVRSGRAV